MSQFQRSGLAASLFTLAACSGGSSDSGGPIEGLQAPQQIEIVTVEGAQSTPQGLTPPTAQTPSFAADSDYMTDVASNHVYDPSMEQIATVNHILCFLSQTGATEMVNAGPYNAQINEQRCEQGGDPSASSTGQSSGVALVLSTWVVNSVRQSRTSPQTVSFWVPQNDDNGQSMGSIYARATISDSPSAENPFGRFALNFAMVPDQGDVADALGHGTLETVDAGGNTLGFGFFETSGDLSQVTTSPGDYAQVVAVLVSMNADETDGRARLTRSTRYYDEFLNQDSGIQTEEYLLDFSATEVLRELVGGGSECLSRTNFHYNTWRYNLYDAVTGERVELNSGFPIRTAGGGYGWLGYHGLWVPPGEDVANGDVVQRVEFGSDTTSDYTILKAPGKLIRHRRDTLLLADADGIDFEWFDFQSQPPARVRLNVVQGQWFKTAQWDDPGQTWAPLESPELLDTQALGFVSMYSQSLGGPCSYRDGDPLITYFRTNVVDGAADLWNQAVNGAVQLYGYVQCLDSGITGAEAQQGDVYLADVFDVNTPYAFEFRAADLALYRDNGQQPATRVGLADNEAPQGGPFSWGLRSGPLVTDTAGLVSVWDVWSVDEFYVYETGHNPWNCLITALDAQNQPVSFDPPLQFTYTHSTLNDKNGSATHNGAVCVLNYNGPGDLHGIPHQGVDFNNDGSPDRFYPTFSIADGVLCGPTGDEYVIRAVGSEIRLQAAPGGCTGLDTANASSLTLPNGSSYVAPDIGPRPTVTAPPAVIEGVVQ